MRAPRNMEAFPQDLPIGRVLLAILCWLALVTGIIGAACLLGGCAGPKQFAAPDSTALVAAQKELAASVAQARVKVAGASRHADAAAGHQRDATVSHSKETVLAGEIGPRLLALRTRVTDAVLRAEVDAISGQVAELAGHGAGTDAALAKTGAEIDLARDDIGGTIASLVIADRQAGDINARLGPEYLKKVGDGFAAANAEILIREAKAARAEKRAVIGWSAFGLAAIAFAAFAYFSKR